MKYPLTTARQFSTNRVNKKKSSLLNLLVGMLLLLVLVGTLAPLILQWGFSARNLIDNFTVNIAPQKIEALTPIAPSFKEQISSKIDPETFTIAEVREVDDFTLAVTSQNNIVALFSSQSDVESQISSLQTILAKSRIESKQVKKIDLRFNKTVVEYQEVKR